MRTEQRSKTTKTTRCIFFAHGRLIWFHKSMPFTRFELQSKIIIIIAIAVVSVVGLSTYIAMLLTRVLVEEEIYNKALAQARATAHQLVNEDALQSPERLLK